MQKISNKISYSATDLGHRWHRKLFDGTHASIEDLAKSENISPSFVSRILRLAYLSPIRFSAARWR